MNFQRKNDKKIELDWWTVEDGGIVLTDKAPKWLVKEMNQYEKTEIEFERKIEKYAVYDGPYPDIEHPIINRLDDEEIDLLYEMLFKDNR